MGDTIRLGLPLLSAGQAQKEVTHNEALLAIDRLLHIAVLTRGLNTPPPSPVAGSIYIIGPVPTGAWSGQAGRLASHDGFGWTIVAPVRGCLAWIVDEASFAVFDTVWSQGGWPSNGLKIGGRTLLAATPVAISSPSGGTVIDVEARAKISALLAALHDQGVIL